MEQTDVPAAPSGPIVSPPRLSEEVRASLEAVRVAQVAARLRARRQTVQARLWFAASVAAIALVAVGVGSRVVRARHARRQAVASIRPLPLPPQPAAPETPSAAAETVVAAAPANSAIQPETPDRSAPALSPIPAQAKARNAGASDQACDTGLIRSAPWRLSPEACAQAFDADPTNARLALAIAHAEHVRGHFDEAAQWAKRALALDPKAAEAYVLIARADVHGGRGEDAATAYRRYLELAPRGWHKAEARAGVQRPRE